MYCVVNVSVFQPFPFLFSIFCFSSNTYFIVAFEMYCCQQDSPFRLPVFPCSLWPIFISLFLLNGICEVKWSPQSNSYTLNLIHSRIRDIYNLLSRFERRVRFLSCFYSWILQELVVCCGMPFIFISAKEIE